MATEGVLRMLVNLVGAVLLLVTGLLVFVYVFQSRLVYFPSTLVEATPADAGMPYEELRLRAADGVALQAWFVPVEGAAGTILFFHGNGGNLSHRLDSLRMLHELGWSVLILSYRGYGASEGSPDEAGTYRDAEAAWRYLVEERGVAPGGIVLFGRSLGGAVAAWLAERERPAGVILESTFTSVPDMAGEIYGFVPRFLLRRLSRIRYPTIERVGAIQAPVLVVHSRQDEIIPFHHGRMLWEAASEPKRFVEIAGGHNEGFLISGTRYREAIRDFLEEVRR
jgi:uncharacterized protein